MAVRLMQGKVWPYLLLKPVLPVGIAFLPVAEHSLLYKPQLIFSRLSQLSGCAKKQSVVRHFWVFYYQLSGQKHQDSLIVSL